MLWWLQAELARIRQLREQATEADRARWAAIEAAAAQWDGAEQARLDAALTEVPADVEDQQRRWEAIAALLRTRSPEACLARVQYIRKQAQLQVVLKKILKKSWLGLELDLFFRISRTLTTTPTTTPHTPSVTPTF